jgi:hypothetical protein
MGTAQVARSALGVAVAARWPRVGLNGRAEGCPERGFDCREARMALDLCTLKVFTARWSAFGASQSLFSTKCLPPTLAMGRLLLGAALLLGVAMSQRLPSDELDAAQTPKGHITINYCMS